MPLAMRAASGAATTGKHSDLCSPDGSLLDEATIHFAGMQER